MQLGVEKLNTAYDLWIKGIINSAENLRRMEGTSNISEIHNMARDEEIHFSYGETQESIYNYVDRAYTNENTVDYKKYAKVDSKLVTEVKDDIDISNYNHALRDNDIRHIRNSHGEETNEKYPVTKDDIKAIPYIVQYYDKVIPKIDSKGNPGIVYVKVTPKGITYYLEAVTTKYGNEPLLVNKQMIKLE